MKLSKDQKKQLLTYALCIAVLIVSVPLFMWLRDREVSLTDILASVGIGVLAYALVALLVIVGSKVPKK